MKEKQQHLTLEGIKKFQDELDHLTQVRMEEIKVKLQEARAQGDLSENAEYDAAREEQAMVYERIQELQYILKNAVVIESDEGSDVITIGSTVTYRDDETNEELTDLLELHFIELGKMKEMREDSPITFWIEFFKEPYSEKVKELCEYVPEIKEAKEVFEKAKADPEAQELIRLREKGLRDYISGLENAHDQGREEGIESERKKNALNMKAEGFG